MQYQLGETLRVLRSRDGKTQEELAKALGVTAQAVSRWETGSCYPDTELLPAIANLFGVSIDELFGYRNDRDKKVDAILRQADGFSIKSRGDGEWLDACIDVLRTGLKQFPQNERLLLALADTLSETGWRRNCEWVYYDDEGFIRHDYDRHRENKYWAEAIAICERLLAVSHDGAVVAKAVSLLVLLYRNLGEYGKAVACAERMPEMKHCREVLLAASADGKAEARYIGELLLRMLHIFSEQLVYGLIANLHHFDSDLPVRKVKGVIDMYGLVCDDGRFGVYHDDLVKLYLYLSRLQWACGYRDDAFVSLDEALAHARALDALAGGEEYAFTAPLVSFVRQAPGEGDGRTAELLPDDWPFWMNPDYGQVEREIKADPRWAAWAARCRE